MEKAEAHAFTTPRRLYPSSPNLHMRNEGITGACERDEFLAKGEAQFSEAVKQKVGAIMYEGNRVVSYEEWHGRVQEWVELMLGDPDQPYMPTQ